jgi:hypothetical protein
MVGAALDGTGVPLQTIRSRYGDLQIQLVQFLDPATLPPLSVVVLGLSPCVQRTLIFEQREWARGCVNRADAAAVSVGGKGQHVALALLRADADADAGAVVILSCAGFDDDGGGRWD